MAVYSESLFAALLHFAFSEEPGLKRNLLVTLAALGAVFVSSSAHAAFVLNFDGPLSGQPSIGGSAPYAQLTISSIGANTVHFSLQHFTDPGGVDPTRFISELELNIDPFVPGLSMTNATMPIGFAANEDGFNDASHRFDLQFSFPTANGSRLEQGGTASWDLTAPGLNEFLFMSTAVRPNGDATNVFGLLHMQSIGPNGANSTKLAAVPEPASLTALGLFGIALLRRRRK